MAIEQNQVVVRTEISFGEWLISRELLNQEQLHEALTEQRLNGGRLGEVLVRQKIFDENDLTENLAEYLSLDFIRIDSTFEIDMDIARQLPEKIAKRFVLMQN